MEIRAKRNRNVMYGARAFTILELLTVVALLSIISAIAVPRLASVQGQLEASSDTRRLMSTVGSLRAEAIRLRSNIRISFTTTGYTWDIYDDGTSEGSLALSRNSSWSGSTPADIILNGLGLARGISGTRTITITARGWDSSIGINSNGYIER